MGRGRALTQANMPKVPTGVIFVAGNYQKRLAPACFKLPQLPVVAALVTMLQALSAMVGSRILAKVFDLVGHIGRVFSLSSENSHKAEPRKIPFLRFCHLQCRNRWHQMGR